MTTEGAGQGPLRHELKHQINPREDLVLSGRLRRLFPRDSHAGAQGHIGSPVSISTPPTTTPCGRR